MPIDLHEIIDSFKNLESISQITKEKLTKLNTSLLYVPPELIKERLFNNFKSQQGLCSILMEHESENNNAIILYNKIVKDLNEDNS
tara:strand:- start:128 stop:385 length:258 start_codon:yes stop_codon:yes gene_type:complete